MPDDTEIVSLSGYPLPIDYNSGDFAQFKAEYDGMLKVRIAYKQHKIAQKLDELRKQDIYMDGHGILNQRW